MESRPFISFDLRQPINQWISIALIALMAFWVVLYYFTNKADAFGQVLIYNYETTDAALTK